MMLAIIGVIMSLCGAAVFGHCIGTMLGDYLAERDRRAYEQHR